MSLHKSLCSFHLFWPTTTKEKALIKTKTRSIINSADQHPGTLPFRKICVLQEMEDRAKFLLYLVLASLAFLEVIQSNAVPVTSNFQHFWSLKYSPFLHFLDDWLFFPFTVILGVGAGNLILQEPQVLDHIATRTSSVSRSHRVEAIKWYIKIESLTGTSFSMDRLREKEETLAGWPLMDEEWTLSWMTTRDQGRITATLQGHNSEEGALIVSPDQCYN